MIKKLHIPFNIQLFAEGESGENGGSGNNNPTPKVYSEEEYNKLKSRVDDLCKNEKALKDQLKSKQTDEEKKAQEDLERESHYKEIENENKSMKIAKELALGGYNEKEVADITTQILNSDVVALAKSLTNLRKELADTITKQVKQELINSNLAPGGNSDDDTKSSIGARLGKTKATQNTAREFYQNRKQ